ncbi:O-antigen ligase family protein [Paradevosia shaoguanensis]|uniref:O-antigen ligase domain-containing protein n=1 Tax=Paradevosia shaoguanensis TaxID=1335043 RepID=A0AA41QKG3_9HYPH|nr:hypothetical protein [Paradevosia shaoguanensis]MCF1740880.1 hypothetical protein [Paradevosia shaoguanensis]MCI0125364.1 hypothetical protein [Paradevosia shaoguanensis]
MSLAPTAPRTRPPRSGTVYTRGPAMAAPEAKEKPASVTVTTGWQRLAAVFVVSLLLPWLVSIGPLNLSPYRIVLLLAFPFCLVRWLSGRAGGVRVTDLLVVLFCIWCGLSMVNANGIGSAWQSVGIQFIELFGAYLLARCAIRSADDFVAIWRLALRLAILAAPLLVFETLTGTNLFTRFSIPGLHTYEASGEMRNSYFRAAGPFEHPILNGTFFGSLLAFAALVYAPGTRLYVRLVRCAAVVAATISSLSAGPIGILGLQGGLLLWNTLLRKLHGRWIVLASLVGAGITALSLVARRPPIEIITSLIVFDPQSYWFRTLIWKYAMAAIAANGLFGTPGNWARPYWMPASIDNLWLLTGVFYGYPALILLALIFVSVFIELIRAKVEPRIAEYRLAILISLISFALTGLTVHIWGAAAALLFFVLGSGSWMLAKQEEPARQPSPGKVKLRLVQ